MKSVVVPFISGQQEGVDAKILPAGYLSAAVNLRMDREGRIVRRRGLEEVPMQLPSGDAIAGVPREFGYPNVVLHKMDNLSGTGVGGLVRHVAAGALVSCATLAGLIDNGEFEGDPDVYPGTSGVDRDYSPLSPFGDVRRASVGTGAGDVGAPQSAVTVGGAVVTLSAQQNLYTTEATQASRYVVEMRDPATLEVFHRYNVDIAGTSTVFIGGSPRLIASRTRPLMAVVFTTLSSEPQGQGLIKVYSTEPPYREYKPVRVATPVSGNRSDSIYADVLPDDTIVIAVDESDPLVAESKLIRVAAMEWAYALGDEDAHRTGFTISGEENRYLLGIFGGRSTGEFLTLYLVNGEIRIDTAMVNADDWSVSHSEYSSIIAFDFSVVRAGAVWVESIGKWNIVYGTLSSMPYGNPEKTSIRCILWSVFWDGSSVTPDRKIEGGIPVSSPIVEGNSRWLVVEVATGVGLDNFQPNFASGIQIIDLSTGLVLAQLSGDMGGMNVWDGCTFVRTDADRYYVSVGNEIPSLGSRKSAIYSFERSVGMTVRTRAGEVLVAGGMVGVSDLSDAGLAGFSAAPEMRLSGGDSGTLAPGYYLVSVVLEYIDANGRVWRSSPSVPQQIEAAADEGDGNHIEVYVHCGAGAPTAGQLFAAVYVSDVTPTENPIITQTGDGGAISIVGKFGGWPSDWLLTITSADPAQPNGTAEFELRRDGLLIDSGEVVPTTPFEYSIPGTVSAVIVFEDSTYGHNTTYEWSTKIVAESTPLYRVGGIVVPQGGETSEAFSWRGEVPGFPYMELEDQPTLYTQGGVLPNQAPPAADFLCVTRDRVWAAGLPDRCRIQASKHMVPELGIEWSNSDAFSITLPDEVIGLAAVDETLVIITERGVHLASGDGPDDRGLGEFHASQRLPMSMGCINAKSIVVSELGVFYQSRRGIELIPRGFGSPEWIGQGVRDQVDQRPHCWGAVALADGTVRFLMGANEDGGTAVVLVWDQRCKGWFVHSYSTFEIELGRLAIGRLYDRPSGEDSMGLANWSGGVKREATDGEFEGAQPSYLETGWLRPAGLNSDHVVRRVNLLGEYRGPTELTLRWAYDDGPYDDRDVEVRQITGADFNPGDPFKHEQTLTVHHGSSVRLKVSWRPLEDGADSIALTGLSLFWEPNAMGPRVDANSKG